MASSLPDRALTYTCGRHVEPTVHRQCFHEAFLSPRSNFYDRIMSDFNAVLPEGPKIIPLLTEMSPDSLNLLIMIFCTVVDGIYLKTAEALPVSASLSYSFYSQSYYGPVAR